MAQKIYVNVAEKLGTPSALTQEQGNAIYSEIVSAIEQQKIIQLDFNQIERIISPFLNNAIGQLYGKYNSQEISKSLLMMNFPDEKKATLNVVIANAKKFYSNKKKFSAVAEEVFHV